ncbi:hypothetical protein CCHR01_14377 [Colletotrichum chrysophilum]|uniref:Uncharacterized protein n=1 Tax=Colletotrichum chrysophilum TaxID=1836956 RepID=A0AAD9AAB8_9PEZI|nr:hypothetical protein CCHR01_14377 [Colletotrichum chrysophilum]
MARSSSSQHSAPQATYARGRAAAPIHFPPVGPVLHSARGVNTLGTDVLAAAASDTNFWNGLSGCHGRNGSQLNCVPFSPPGGQQSSRIEEAGRLPPAKSRGAESSWTRVIAVVGFSHVRIA